MRPLTLKIQAFGPYLKPITLDFASNLHDEKIFLIHGATGAGKTTILDAICFALYGTASGDERDAAMMRSKGISDKIATEVAFSFALGEKIYDVRRTLTYHPNRKTNQNQFDAQLFCDGNVIETQTRNVTNAISELLGFNAKQFRQVVLLPQGEFKNFLSANSAERQPILDALFNAALYSRIEDGLKFKADAAQKNFDDLNRDRATLTAQLQGISLDESALEKIRADYAAAQKKSFEAKNILAAAQRDYTAAEILSKDFTELIRRNKNLEIAQKNLSDAEKNFISAKTEFDRRQSEQIQREQLQLSADKFTETKKFLIELDNQQKSLEIVEKTFQAATAELKKCEDNATKFDRRLAELKRRRDELSDADKKLSEAKTLLDRVRERETTLQKISRLEGDLRRARQKISVDEKNSTAARIELERLQKLQREGSAARLAKNLRDGEPCPVCGSRVHEHVDFGDAIIPSDSEIDVAKSEADERKKTLDEAKLSAAQIQAAIDTNRDALKKFADLPDKPAAQKIFDDAEKDAAEFADCRRRIDKGEQCITNNNAALTKARDEQTAATAARAQWLGKLQTTQAQIPEKYLANREQLDADIAATQKLWSELDAAWKSADKKFREAESGKSSCEGAFKSAREAQSELADKLRDKQPPDVDALKSRADSAQENVNAAIREETSLKNSLERMQNLSTQLVALDEKISAAEKNLRVWRRLSDAACGKIRGNKLSFARYYLGAMFEQVLTEANYRLEKMSDRRYSLQNKYAGKRMDSTAGLNLEIFDDYTGEARPVATLSGGESFLASLALALGLAAVVRNNLGGIKLDTIFIDEGFGSLDSETLDDAISTIVEQSGGRLVGIISHVEELKNQLPVRLEVIKGKTGSSAKFIS